MLRLEERLNCSGHFAPLNSRQFVQLPIAFGDTAPLNSVIECCNTVTTLNISCCLCCKGAGNHGSVVAEHATESRRDCGL